MTAKIKVLISDSFDPWFNLATENWIFRDIEPNTNVLFLWRNKETVVIGRFQNPWTECNLKAMEEDGIILTRRQSGGGAVFHDLGNTNFTFLSDKKNYSKKVNNQIIINALKKFKIDAFASGRNDICVSGTDNRPRKISGSAFKESPDRAFHHGTLLIDANMTKLGNYLNPSKKKLESKGIQSVRSRVANLVDFNKEINHENLGAEIIHSFFEHYETKCEIELLNHAELKKIEKLNTYYDELKDWNWRFGETPKFKHTMEKRFEWGNMEVHIDSHKGVIKETKIYSDTLHPEMITYLVQNLKGKAYNKNGIVLAIHQTIQDLPMIKDYLEEFETWLIREVQ